MVHRGRHCCRIIECYNNCTILFANTSIRPTRRLWFVKLMRGSNGVGGNMILCSLCTPQQTPAFITLSTNAARTSPRLSDCSIQYPLQFLLSEKEEHTNEGKAASKLTTLAHKHVETRNSSHWKRGTKATTLQATRNCELMCLAT